MFFLRVIGSGQIIKVTINPLSANPEKWSNTLKQIVGNLPTICLSVFDHFMNLALKGLKKCKSESRYLSVKISAVLSTGLNFSNSKLRTFE